MAYAQVKIDRDEAFNAKFIYMCQIRGCGGQISEFPTAEKNPAPVKCKLCQDKATREAIEAEYDARQKEKKEN